MRKTVRVSETQRSSSPSHLPGLDQSRCSKVRSLAPSVRAAQLCLATLSVPLRRRIFSLAVSSLTSRGTHELCCRNTPPPIPAVSRVMQACCSRVVRDVLQINSVSDISASRLIQPLSSALVPWSSTCDLDTPAEEERLPVTDDVSRPGFQTFTVGSLASGHSTETDNGLFVRHEDKHLLCDVMEDSIVRPSRFSGAALSVDRRKHVRVMKSVLCPGCCCHLQDRTLLSSPCQNSVCSQDVVSSVFLWLIVFLFNTRDVLPKIVSSSSPACLVTVSNEFRSRRPIVTLADRLSFDLAPPGSLEARPGD
ncbi:hypothetical protein RRG08_037635 [Elysia crispata]|uniref:Uncharacterized protein n=1 Tax=Elysia crispata TaxID=231223 RepID=A0AAE0YID6_9GAST|nr:hypothetical protein RRG08_037635 [Elysia crispata]